MAAIDIHYERPAPTGMPALARIGLALAAVALFAWAWYASAILRSIGPDHIAGVTRSELQAVKVQTARGPRVEMQMRTTHVAAPDPRAWRPPAGERWTAVDLAVRTEFVQLAQLTSSTRRPGRTVWMGLIALPVLIGVALLAAGAFGAFPRRVFG